MTEQEKNWVIYSLPARRSPELEANLSCLQDCVQTDPIFRRDWKALAKLRARADDPSVAIACC